MKRRIKLLTVIVLLCICGAFLSSCEYIDDLRDSRVVFVDDEEGRKIINNGKTYVRLEGMEDYYDVKKTESIRITKADVPVLLSKTYGYNASYSEANDMFIFLGEIYCAEDKYDYYMAYDRNAIFGTMLVSVYDGETKKLKNLTLTESETELLYRIWTDDSLKVDEYDISGTTQDLVYLWVYACNTEQTLFCKDSLTVMYNTSKSIAGLDVTHTVGDEKYGCKESYLYQVESFDKRELWNFLQKYKEIWRKEQEKSK